MKNNDDIFKYKNSNFVFDKKVVNVFINMIYRSIPGYDLITKMIGEISKNFIKENTNFYDLEASLLGSAIPVLKNNKEKKFNAIAIGNSLNVIEESKKIYSNYNLDNIKMLMFVI